MKFYITAAAFVAAAGAIIGYKYFVSDKNQDVIE